MKLTFLGTGTSTGIPMINSKHPVSLSDDFRDKRLRVSVLVEWGNHTYVIDCGPDFRYQMLRANVNKIDGILFTHEHSDHIAGLDDIRPYCFDMGDVPVFAHKRVMESLEKRFDYIFANKNRYPGAPSVKVNYIENKVFNLSGLDVVPVNVLHGGLQVFGYRFGKLAYLTDVKAIEEEEKLKLYDLDVLVLNALRIDEHPTHLNLSEALELVAELKPKKAYFTHISHKMGFHAEIEKQLPDNVYLAYDGLEVTI